LWGLQGRGGFQIDAKGYQRRGRRVKVAKLAKSFATEEQLDWILA
jgi:hypothetical protein